MTTLIMTAKLNDVDPQAWLADVLGQIADIPQGRLPNYCRGIGSNQICKRPPDRPVCSRRGTRRGLTSFRRIGHRDGCMPHACQVGDRVPSIRGYLTLSGS